MVTGLMIADQKIKAGKIRNALIVSGEHLTPIIEEALSRNLLWNHKDISLILKKLELGELTIDEAIIYLKKEI